MRTNFNNEMLRRIRDTAQQHGGRVGSIFHKIARVAHRVLTSKATGHVLAAATNYRNKHLASQGGGGIFSTLGNILLKGLGLD